MKGYSGRYRGRSRYRVRAYAYVIALAVVAVVGVLLLLDPFRLLHRRESGEKTKLTTQAELTQAPTEAPTEASTEEPTEAPTEEPTQVPTEEPTEKAAYAPIPLTGKTKQYDALYQVGDTGFEMYTYTDEQGEQYAKAVSKTAQALADKATVYALMVPLSSGITLPDELADEPVFGDQQEAEQTLLGMMDQQVKAVPLYDALMRHRTEYIYFRTDHHWTAQGAYYAYQAFCAAKGITPHQLSEYKTREFPGFLGSFYRDSDKNEVIGGNPDTITAYEPLSESVTMDFTDTDGQTITWPVVCDASDYDPGLKYNTFVGGDNPYTVIRNGALSDGSSCVVVKESFANAFIPFLVDHYQTVYILDYRYWEDGPLTDFVEENNVQDVLFVNNLSAIRSSYLLGLLQGIL